MTSPGEEGQPPGGRSPWELLGLGSELAGTLLVGVFLGYCIDRWRGTSPWFLTSGAILGLITAMVNFFRRAIPPKEGK